MHKKSFILVFTLFIAHQSFAQQVWNLESVVRYAMVNNIGVKLSEIQAKNAALTHGQSKLALYPNANLNISPGISSGNNQDPTTFSRVTQTFLNTGLQFQTSADLFNWYSKRNQILSNEWELKAATANVGKVAYDIALAAANAYLQILLALEQQKITGIQIEQTSAQLANTQKLVDAGSLPYLNLTQLEAQLALDSSNYITAKGNVSQSLLNLKGFLSIDASENFEVETPPVSSIPLEPIAELQPEDVYDLALSNQPLQQFNDLKLKAASYATAAAKGRLYPTISMFGGLSTNYLAFQKRPIFSQTINGFSNTPLQVDVNGTNYTVKQPIFVPGARLGFIRPDAVFTQFSDNFRQNLGLNISIPIFNGGAAKTNHKRSQLNEEGLQMQKRQDNLKLKQDIYAAYTAAVIALEKFNASKKTVTSSQATLDFAKKRFDVGVLGSFDLITTQNNLLRAKLEYTINEFDYIFKMKVLEFYRGQGLKL